MRAVIANMPTHWLEERKNAEAAQWDEMWTGVLHMPPMPNTMHQDFEGALAAYLRYRWARPRKNRVFQQVNLAPPDEPNWTLNYRVPDIVLLTPDRLEIDRGTHFAGAPLVVVEIRSPGDETDDKFPFYAGLGVPEVWVFDRDTRVPEVYLLGSGPAYLQLASDPDGWVRSPATGVEFRPGANAKLAIRIAGEDTTADELPDG